MKSNDILKNKKILWIIGVLVVVVLLALIQRKAISSGGGGNTDVLASQKVDFVGYSGHGNSKLDEKTRVETYKKVAQIEGKKANVDQKTMDAIINNAQTVNDLKYPANGQTSGTSNADNINLSTYSQHMGNTNIYTSSTENLKNGEKIYLYVEDKSPKPYIKTGKKNVVVKNLNKPRIVHVNSFVKSHYLLKLKGTNGHGRADFEYNKHKKSIDFQEDYRLSLIDLYKFPNSELSEVDRYFSVNQADKAYSNGDKLKVSQNKIAHRFNNKCPDNIYFVGEKGKSVTFTIKNLKNKHININNLDEINKNFLSEVKSKKHMNWKFLYAITIPYAAEDVRDDDGLAQPDERSIFMAYHDETHNKYYIVQCEGKIKNNTFLSLDGDENLANKKDYMYASVFQNKNDVTLAPTGATKVSKEVAENTQGDIIDIN